MKKGWIATIQILIPEGDCETEAEACDWIHGLMDESRALDWCYINEDNTKDGLMPGPHPKEYPEDYEEGWFSVEQVNNYITEETPEDIRNRYPLPKDTDVDVLPYVEVKKWFRTQNYIDIKKFFVADVKNVINNRFDNNWPAFENFVVKTCVVDSERLFRKIDNIGLTKKLAPGIIMHELFKLCCEVNPDIITRYVFTTPTTPKIDSIWNPQTETRWDPSWS